MRKQKYETIHEHARNAKEAWRIADSYFPTDYEHDSRASSVAGYPVYKSTSKSRENAFYCYVCDLGTRLEVNITEDNWDTTVINIWIDGDDDEPTETETEEAEAETTEADEANDTETDEATAQTVQEWEEQGIRDHVNFERYNMGYTLDEIEATYAKRAETAPSEYKRRELLKVVVFVRRMKEEEKARLLSDSNIDEALSIVNDALYQIDDKINDTLKAALGLDVARSALYEAFKKAAQITKPESPVFKKYNLKDA